MRLSSKVILRAVTVLAKVELLPQHHPTLTMQRFAQQTNGLPWWSAIMDLMDSFPALLQSGVGQLWFLVFAPLPV